MDIKLVTVYEVEGRGIAESIRLFLESQGFDAYVFQESAGITYGLTIGTLGLANVQVPEDQAEKARKVLAEMDAGKFEQPGIGNDDPTDDNLDT